MGIKSNILKESRISNKILCFYIIFVLIISILPFAGLSEKPEIWSDVQGNISTSNDYVNFTVNITSSENVSSFIDWNRSLVGYWNFEHLDESVLIKYIYDNSTWNNNATMIDRYSANKTSGKYGYGLYFNGSGGGELHINHSDEFNLSSELTLELWFKEFETTFNLSFHNTSGNYHDFGYAVDQTSDGGYIFAGQGSYDQGIAGTGDIFISLHDSNGNILDELGYSTAEEDVAFDIIKTNEGKYVFTGWRGGDKGTLLVGEYSFNDSSKNLELTQPIYTSGGEYIERGYSIKQANDGNYIVAGQTNSFGNPDNPDMWLLKLNKSDLSDELINNTFGSSTLSEIAYSVCVTNDGNYTLAGSRNTSKTDIVKIKANNTNKTSWNQKVIWCNNDTGWSNADVAVDIIETEPDYDFLIVGYSNWSSSPKNKQHLFIQKTNSAGSKLWSATYSNNETGKLFNNGYSADQTRDGGYIITGYTGTDNDYLYDSSRDLILIKLDSDGIEEWNRTFDISGQQEGRCIKQTTDGGYIIAGFTNNSDSNWMEFWLFKTNITGHLTESNNNQSLNKTLIGKGRDSYQLELCNGTITGYLNNETVVSNSSFDLYNLSQNWNHLVLTYNKNAIGDKTKLYLNKELVDSNSTFSDFILNNTKNLTIGRNFSGIIDEVRVWNRELSFEEICASYNISSGIYNKNFTNLFSGLYNYSIHAINSQGEENRSNGTITINLQDLDLPIITTNSSTGVKETNATLNGYLQNNGTASTTVGFWYDTTSGGATNNKTIGTISQGTEFNYNATGLTSGQLYYFKSWAYNSEGFVNGTERTFLTKPNTTISGSFHAQTNSSSIIYLTWTKGEGANNTYIERNITSSWPRGSGTEIYNSTGTKYEDIGLNTGTTYYYQAWSFTNWTYYSTINQWSDNNESTSNTTNNIPVLSNQNPLNGSSDISLNPTLQIQVNHSDGYQMNITWYWGTNVSCSNQIGINNSVPNGTYYQLDTNDNFSSNSKKYYWKVTVNDGQGEWTNETYYFTTESSGTTPGGGNPPDADEQDDTDNETNNVNDTTGPSITIITPKDGEITFDKKPKIKASYSDETGINTTSIVFKLDGKIKSPTIFSSYLTYLPSSDLSSGAHDIYLKVSDTLGNSNSKSWSFKINQSIYHESQNITNTTKGNKTIIDPTNKTKTIVDGIEITPNKNYENIEIEITDLGENISVDIKTPEPPDINKTYIIYRYLDFRIKSNNTYITEDIGDIKINFTVNLTWLKHYEINISNVTMLRYHNKSWVKLDTNFTRKIDNKTLFQCSTPGFSTFAVVGSKIVKKEDTLEKPEEIPWIIIIGFVIAAIAILILILFKAGYIYIEKE